MGIFPLKFEQGQSFLRSILSGHKNPSFHFAEPP